MIFKGLLCNLVSVNDLDYCVPSIDSVPVVNEFEDVFFDDFPEFLPLERLTLYRLRTRYLTNFNSSLQNGSS